MSQKLSFVFCFLACILFGALYTADSHLRPEYTYTVVQVFSLAFFPLLFLGIIFSHRINLQIALYMATALMLSLSPVLLRLHVQTKGIDIDDALYTTVLFFAGQIFVAVALSFLLSCIAKGYTITNIFSKLICIFFLCAPCAIAMLYGLNFATSGTLNADGIVAFFQSDLHEATDYLLGNMVCIRGVALCCMVLLLVVMAMRGLQQIFVLSTKNIRYYPSAVLLCVLGGSLTWANATNCMTRPFIEAFDVIAEYDAYKKQASLRQASLVGMRKEDHAIQQGTYVLVIGESLSRYHMSAYGYEKDTTPWLQAIRHAPHQIYFLEHAYSCHVHTVPALNYALTAKNQYNSMDFAQAPSLLEMARHVGGYKTYWISNQFQHGAVNTPMASFASQADVQLWLQNPYWTGLDGETVKALSTLELKGEKNLVIVHLIGSHYPYIKRYPKKEDTEASLDDIEAYDKSVMYNDAIVQQLYDVAQGLPNFRAFVYFSDHGEDVESGKRHEASRYSPRMPAIPMWFAFSPDWQSHNPQRITALLGHGKTAFTNDMLFDTMLGIMGVTDNPFYVDYNDISSAAYNHEPAHLKTMYGTQPMPLEP